MSTPTPSVLDINSIDTDSLAVNKDSSVEDFDAAVNTMFIEYARRADLLDANEKVDTDVLDARITEKVKRWHVVNIDPDDDDRRDPSSSGTKDELTSAIFIAGPTLADAEKDAVWATLYAKCQSTVWNRTQSGKRGAVQKRLDGEKLVLIHGKVFRHGNPIKDGIYVSTHAEALLRDYWGPRLAKLRKLSDAFEEDYTMTRERVPAEVDEVVRAAIESAFVEATAKLPVQTLELGKANARKALDK